MKIIEDIIKNNKIANIVNIMIFVLSLSVSVSSSLEFSLFIKYPIDGNK